MTDYTHVLSDASIPGAESSFGSYEILADATFMWPYNYSRNGPTISKILEITPNPGVSMTLPSALEAAKGEAFLLRNIGINDLIIKKADGTSLTILAAGSVLYLYITDSSTAGGVWGLVNFGVGSSLADAASLSGYGLTTIGSVLNSALPTEVQSSSWTVDEYDRAKVFIYTGGVGTLALPVSSTVGDDFFIMLRNSGSGTLTIDPSFSETIDEQVTLEINPGESLILVCNGVEWYTVGYGRSMLYQFTQLTKDISAGGTITLSDSESSNKLFKFIGSPAGTVNVVVPNVVAVYYVYNALSTAQTLNLKTAAGAAAAIAQGQRAIVFCDGTDVLAAQTASISGDLSLTDGSAPAPSLKFATSTQTGLFKYGASGLGFALGGAAVGYFTTDGLIIPTGYLQLPSSATPSQIVEGAMVWDSDSDLLVIGTGSGQKVLIDSDALTTLLALKANLASPTFTGTVSGITKSMVGLGNVDNTSDANKPVSTAQQTALDLKASTSDMNLRVLASAPSISGTLDCNNNNITEIKTASFNTVPTLTTTTGAVAVDWSAAQNYYQNEPTGNITYTFTAPPGPCHLQLYIHSDGASASKTFTWPGTVIWYGFTWNASTANKKAMINFWYDGTNYHAQGSSQV